MTPMAKEKPTEIVDLIEEELEEAFEVKNRKALRRSVLLIVENLPAREVTVEQFNDLKSDVKTIAEVMREGFRQIDKRFEQVDKRFEQVDKRFEDMNRRFNQLTWIIGILFGAVVAVMKFL